MLGVVLLLLLVSWILLVVLFVYLGWLVFGVLLLDLVV